MTNLKIASAQFVKAATFTKAFEVGTARSYAAKYGEDAEAAHARAIQNGHDTAYTINAGSMMTDDVADNLRRNALAAAQFADAIEVADGDTVEIEGETYRVRVMGQQYSDPIHFKRIAA